MCLDFGQAVELWTLNQSPTPSQTSPSCSPSTRKAGRLYMCLDMLLRSNCWHLSIALSCVRVSQSCQSESKRTQFQLQISLEVKSNNYWKKLRNGTAFQCVPTYLDETERQYLFISRTGSTFRSISSTAVNPTSVGNVKYYQADVGWQISSTIKQTSVAKSEILSNRCHCSFRLHEFPVINTK